MQSYGGRSQVSWGDEVWGALVLLCSISVTVLQTTTKHFADIEKQNERSWAACLSRSDRRGLCWSAVAVTSAVMVEAGPASHSTPITEDVHGSLLHGDSAQVGHPSVTAHSF